MKTLSEKRDYLTRQINERKAAMLDAERAVREHEKTLAGLYGALDTVEMMAREADEATQAVVDKAATRTAAPAGGTDLSDAPQNLG